MPIKLFLLTVSQFSLSQHFDCNNVIGLDNEVNLWTMHVIVYASVMRNQMMK